MTEVAGRPGQAEPDAARGRPPDGRLPSLQTVFQFIDLCDELSFRVRDDGEVRRVNEVGCSAQIDLTVRAANLLRSEAGVRGRC